MSKTILMVAFEFPPSNGASVPRIESFYRYLKQWGWKVIVLTAKPHAYTNKDVEYIDKHDDLIYRTTALDVQRHFTFKGKYLEIMATPDSWGLTWIPSAVRKGKQLISEYKPDIIWSSSPIPSTHFIANKLSTKFTIPWLADYRDPFHYMNGSAGKWLDKFHQRIDKSTLAKASHLTFATNAVRDLYAETYKELINQKITVIENGYDEANFEKLNQLENVSTPFNSAKFTLYYSGVLYPNGRDPIPLFKALSELKHQQQITNENFELIFQGAGDGFEFVSLFKQLAIDDLITFVKPVSFIQAIYNMTQANALLLIQDSRFNRQIPGKVYEYLRTGKPLLVKADPIGETAKLVSKFEGVSLGYEEQSMHSHLLNITKRDSLSSFRRQLAFYNRENKAKILQKLLISILN
jgi:glycosyltransferase involved in cell wall biosynthesis